MQFLEKEYRLYTFVTCYAKTSCRSLHFWTISPCPKFTHSPWNCHDRPEDCTPHLIQTGCDFLSEGNEIGLIGDKRAAGEVGRWVLHEAEHVLNTLPCCLGITMKILETWGSK